MEDLYRLAESRPTTTPPNARGVHRTFSGAGEPAIDEVLSDSIVRQMMARDGVGADQLTTLIDQVRLHLA